MKTEDRIITRDRIVTLCGSTKFKKEFLQIAEELGENGLIPISVTSFTHADGIDTPEELAAILDATHALKIMNSEGIFVINKNGYIGYSTMREIAFAAVLYKGIMFLEEPSEPIKHMLSVLMCEDWVLYEPSSHFGTKDGRI